MAGTNDFKAFATDANANVTSQEEWETLTALKKGFSSGKASSAQVSKALRQPSTMAAVLGQFIANAELDALDDGDVDGLVAKLATAITTNLGLGTAAKKDIGTGTGQVPDMSSFTYTTTGSGVVIRLPGNMIIQMDVSITDSNGFYNVNMGVAMSSYHVFAVEGHVSGWTASGGIYQLLTVYGAEKVNAGSFNVRSATWRSSDHNFTAQPTVFSWITIGRA